MVVESSSAWLTLHDPFIGVHLEHSATIFAVIRYSMTLLCSVEGEHICNSIRTMHHHNAPEVSFKHTAGRPGIAVYLRRILHLSDVCEHRRIGELANSSLAVQKHLVPVNYSSFHLLHEDDLSVVGIFFVRDCFFLNGRVHLVSNLPTV